MNKLFENANEYVKQSNWQDLSALKLCLFSLGVLFGMFFPKKNRKVNTAFFGTMFAVTCVPQVAKFVKIVLGKSK